MAYVTLYNIPDLNFHKNNAVTFENIDEYNGFFSKWSQYSFPTDYIGWIKDYPKMEQAITVPKNIFRNYNYVKINQDSITQFYYIIDYKEFGNDQWELDLRFDGIMTYISKKYNPEIDLTSKKSLLIRTHQNRFDLQEKTINIDSSIEAIEEGHKSVKTEKIFELGYEEGHKINLSFIENTAIFGDFWLGDEYYKTPNNIYLRYDGNWNWLSRYKDTGNDASTVFPNVYAPNVYSITVENDNYAIVNYIDSNDAWSDGQMDDLLLYSYPRSRVRFAFGNLNDAQNFEPVAFLFTEKPIKYPTNQGTQTVTFHSSGWAVRGDYVMTLDGITYPITDDWSQYFHRIISDGSRRKLYRQGIFGVGSEVVMTLPPSSSHTWTTSNSGTEIFSETVGLATWEEIKNTGKLEIKFELIKETKTFSDLDIKDARYSKIIEYPYLPKNLNVKWSNDESYISFTDALELQINEKIDLQKFDLSGDDKYRVVSNEPKLLHSQFTQYLLSIHKQMFPITLERMGNFIDRKNNSDYFEVNLKIDMTMDLSTPSNIMLKYDKTRLEQPLENEFLFPINNQVAQFISEGYTYAEYYKDNELRQREIQKSMQDRNIAISTLNTAFGVVGGMFPTGAEINPLYMGARTIQAGVNIYGSIQEHMDRQKLDNLEYKNKMTQMLLSNVNVVGGGINLMRKDDHDKLRLIKIEPIGEYRRYLQDIFYYFGYKTLEYRDINLRRRKYFTYIQAELDERLFDVFPNLEIKNDIIRRFREGITMFHVNKINNDYIIDFKQTKENWEEW